MLSRDKNWVRWKMENCQPIIRDRVSTVDFLEAKSGAQKAYSSRKVRSMLAGLDLRFLSDSESASGLERLKDLDRYAPLTRIAYSLRCAYERSDMSCPVQSHLQRPSQG